MHLAQRSPPKAKIPPLHTPIAKWLTTTTKSIHAYRTAAKVTSTWTKPFVPACARPLRQGLKKRRLALSPRLEPKIPNTFQQSPGRWSPRSLKGVRLWLRTAGGFAVLSKRSIQDQQNQIRDQHDLASLSRPRNQNPCAELQLRRSRLRSQHP